MIGLFLYVIVSILFLFNGEKIKEQEMQLKTYEKYSPIIFELIDEIKGIQHDYKNHINTIYGIVQTEDDGTVKARLEEYLTLLNNSLVKLDKHIIIDNKIISAIVYTKNASAQYRNINFIYEINCSLKDIQIQDYEISEVLNNLIDNVFEAVKEECDKCVFLRISYVDNNYLLEIKN